MCLCAVLSKPHNGMTSGLRHGTQFDMPVREELVTEDVGIRGDAGQVK